MHVHAFMFPMCVCSCFLCQISPWYNHYGSLGVKHRVTYSAKSRIALQFSVIRKSPMFMVISLQVHQPLFFSFHFNSRPPPPPPPLSPWKIMKTCSWKALNFVSRNLYELCMDVLTSVGCAGNGGGAMKNFQRLVRGIWAPGSNEFLQPSLWVTVCVCVCGGGGGGGGGGAGGSYASVHVCVKETACMCMSIERESWHVCVCVYTHMWSSVQVRFLVHILSLTWVPWWMVLITMYTFAWHLYIMHSFLLSQIPYQFPQPILSVTQACKHTGRGGGGGGGDELRNTVLLLLYVCKQWVWGVFMHIHL